MVAEDDPGAEAAKLAVANLVESWGEQLTVGNALEAAVAVREGTEAYLVELVRHARQAGASWASIGGALGVTPQAAHQRYRHVTRAPAPRTRRPTSVER